MEKNMTIQTNLAQTNVVDQVMKKMSKPVEMLRKGYRPAGRIPLQGEGYQPLRLRPGQDVGAQEKRPGPESRLEAVLQFPPSFDHKKALLPPRFRFVKQQEQVPEFRVPRRSNAFHQNGRSSSGPLSAAGMAGWEGVGYEGAWDGWTGANPPCGA